MLGRELKDPSDCFCSVNSAQARAVTCHMCLIQLPGTSLPQTFLHSHSVPGRGHVMAANLGSKQETVLCCLLS